jgi:transposase-like protein
MGKQGIKRRVYIQKFKTESAAVVAKHEKPVSQIAADLGIKEHMLRRWVKSVREPACGPSPGPGRPRDEELTPLRKKHKALRNAHEIFKKRWSSSRRETSSDGVPVHTSEPGNIHHPGDGRIIGA